jgi:hypothetical protein
MFDWVAQENGVYWSGFMLAGAIVVVGTLLVTSVRANRGVAPVELGMADILICSTPAVGDLGPPTAIGGHLVSRGHRVRMIAGSRFAETVESAGIAHVPLRGAADIDDRDLDAPCLNGGPGAAWPSCATKSTRCSSRRCCRSGRWCRSSSQCGGRMWCSVRRGSPLNGPARNRSAPPHGSHLHRLR